MKETVAIMIIIDVSSILLFCAEQVLAEGRDVILIVAFNSV